RLSGAVRLAGPGGVTVPAAALMRRTKDEKGRRVRSFLLSSFVLPTTKEEAAMNLKTTLALLLLLAAVVGLAWHGVHLPEEFDPLADRRTAATEEPAANPLKGVTAKSLRKIEIRRGNVTTVLTRTGDGPWVMPGNWPTRPREVADLVALLANLRSRFAPIAIDKDEL